MLIDLQMFVALVYQVVYTHKPPFEPSSNINDRVYFEISKSKHVAMVLN